jgi:hypothetical protein
MRVSPLFWVSYVLLWVLVVVLAVSVLALYHHFGQMYLNSREGRGEQGPAIGHSFPPDEATDLDGEAVMLPAAGRPMLVLYASTTCPICGELREDVVRLGGQRSDVSVVVFCEGTKPAVAAWAQALTGTARVVVDARGRYATRHNIAGTPFCVAIGGDGRVRARAIVNGFERLSLLADEAAGVPLDHRHETHERVR